MSRRSRRKRRQARAAQRHGTSAKPTHRLRSGRTGQVHHKKTPPKKHAPYVMQPRTVEVSVRCAKCGARPGETHRH